MGKLIYLRPEKILFDTSVYISRLNSGRHAKQMDELGPVIPYLHSTVFEELLAGTRTEKEKKELFRLKKAFLKKGRMVVPTDRDWEETGLMVNHFVRQGSFPVRNGVAMTHDILISISARNSGIRVITENKKDFERIQKVRDFKLTVWSALDVTKPF